MAEHQNVSIIGSGNLAWHLAPALDNAGYVVKEVYSRNARHAEKLTSRLYQAEVKTSLDFSDSASRGSVDGPDLSFEIVSMEGSENTKITATTQKEMKTAARGQVIIYNKYSASPQKLSVDTRLEGSNGKIYKTDKEVVIPGMTGDTPGFIKVGVYGYEPGEAYNSGPLDFKVFGFRGTGKYDKFYARSEGDITGGMSGNFYVVSDEEKAKVSSGLALTLKDNLTKKVLEQVPEDYLLFKDSLVFREGKSDDKNARLV